MMSGLNVCRRFARWHPVDAARALEGLPGDEVAALFEEDPAIGLLTVGEMMPTAAADCLAAMRPAAAAPVLSALRPDMAADLLRRMDPAARATVLGMLEPDQADPLRTLLRFREGTAGALLDPRALAFPETVTVGEASRRLRRSAGDMLYYLYVVDDARRLTGVLDVRELLTARAGAPVSAVMHADVVRLRASADRAAILSHPGWRRFHALPVVDGDGVLLGAIRYQTFRRLEEQSATQEARRDPFETARALGELYWLGVTGMLEGLAATAAHVDAPRQGGGRLPDGR